MLGFRRRASSFLKGPKQFKVAGVSFRDDYPNNLLKLGQECGGDHALAATLVRDPSNDFDPNAIEVHVEEGGSIGYIPAEAAKSLAPLLDSGQHVEVEAWIRIDKRHPNRPGAEVRVAPLKTAA